MNKTRKSVMNLAWMIAKEAQRKHGGKISQYIALSMKQAWTTIKKNVGLPKKENKAQRIQKTTSEISAIKDWFVRKNFTANEAYVIETNDWIEVVEETAKAFKLVVHNADLGNINTWAPKSCCVA